MTRLDPKMMHDWPARAVNVGIKAMQVYIPPKAVSQEALEKHDGVSKGKYTIGLGQQKMSFCDDRQDIYSIALTVVSDLMRSYSIDPATIGRLEVGTETLLDKSKSIKSVLMQLFEPSGNTNIEGADTYNACYGGTNALFNAVNWVESSSWDGRDAIVVCGDIVVYAEGPARPTGGAGAVAMLIGADAPLAFESGLRGSCMRHTYDFYKPNPTSEYPVVFGEYSIECYKRALDSCYAARQTAVKSRAASALHSADSTKLLHAGGPNGLTTESKPQRNSGVGQFDYMCFHAPTCKLVSKSYARLRYMDFLANKADDNLAVPASLRNLSYEDSISSKELEKFFGQVTEEDFVASVHPGLLAASQCGNMYTASLYTCLASLLSTVGPEDLIGKRIGLFSFGSGLASTMFSLRVTRPVEEIVSRMELREKLQRRTLCTPDEYEEALKLREEAHLRNNFTPKGSIADLARGEYYLTRVDGDYRRFHAERK